MTANKEKVSVLVHYPALWVCHRDFNYFHYYYFFIASEVGSVAGWILVTVIALMLDIFQLIYVFLYMYFLKNVFHCMFVDTE